MPHVLSCADIVLSRSGANSLWECVATEKPMILIPLSGAGTRGDQVENAHFFEQQGAALVVNSAETQDCISKQLKETLEIMLDFEVLKNTKESVKSMAKKNPAETIAEFLVTGA